MAGKIKYPTKRVKNCIDDLGITARAFLFCNSLLLPLEFDRRRNRDAIRIEISIINDPIET